MIEKIKKYSETEGQNCFYVGLKDGRVFLTIVYHYWHNTGTIRDDGKADVDHKGFRMTLTPCSSTVFNPPYEVTNHFPEAGGAESIFRKLIENNLTEWDTYYTDRNPALVS